MLILLLISLSILSVHSLQIPRIDDVILVPVYQANFTSLINITCNQCLCSASTMNSIAVNCFSNNQSCQLFSSFPRTYGLQPTSQSFLYFPQGVFPNDSQCCMPNITDLLQRLSSAKTTVVNVTTPRCLVVDDHGYLVTVKDSGDLLSRFYLQNLTLIDSGTFVGGAFRSITYQQGAYYIGGNDQKILVVDSDNLTVLNTITAPLINNPRDLMFIDDGEILVLASLLNNNLLFFNRSSNGGTNYSYTRSQSTSYPWPHGLWYVNDSFFYTTSWTNDAVYSYTRNNLVWNESLFINARPLTVSTSGSGGHIKIDECGRSWFAIQYHGIFIYDQQGSFLGNFTPITIGIFDIMFVDNYVMYLSDNTGGRIFRLEPNVTCS